MKLKKKYTIIVPGLIKNSHLEKGDLSKWGDSTFLEWKYHQCKKLDIFNKRLFVATPDKVIGNYCKQQGMNFFYRKKNEKLSDFHLNLGKKFKGTHIVILNATSPLFGGNVIIKAIKKYVKNNIKDSLLSYVVKKEFFFYEKRPINFDSNKYSISRKSVKPLFQIVNSISIIDSKKCILKKNIIGDNPLFYKVDEFSGLEIKNLKEYTFISESIRIYEQRKK